MALPAAVLSVLVQAKGIQETNEKLRKIQGESERTAKSTEKLEGRFSKLDNTVGDFNRTMTASGNVVKLVKFPALIAGAGVATQAIGALSAGAIGLGSALAPLSGLAAAGAAGYAAMGQAAGVLKLATNGLTKAVGGNKAALKALPPAGRELVAMINELKPKFKDLQQTAQAGLLPGLAKGVKAALPVLAPLKNIIAGTARALGDLAAKAGALVGSKSVLSDLTTIGATNTRVIRLLGTAALSLAHALLGVTAAGGPLLVWLSKGAVKLADWIDKQVIAGRESGKLAAFLERTKAVASTLGHVLVNLATGLFNIGKAANPLGTDLLGKFEKLTEKFKDWTASVSGQNALRKYFDNARAPILQVVGLVGDLGAAFLRLSTGKGASPLVAQLRTLVPVLENVVANTTAAFGPALIDALGNVLRLFGDLAGSSGPLVVMVQLIGLLAGGLHSLLTVVPGLNSMTVSFIGLYGVLKATSVVFGPLVAGAKALEVALIGQTAAANLAAGATLRERAAMIATAVAMYASAAATAVMTAATAALDVALAVLTSPITLVVVALAALAAGVIYAYKHSETFRNIVNAAWKAVKDAATALWDVAKVVFPAIVAIVTAAWNAIKTVTTTVWGAIRTVAEGVWNGMRTVATTVWSGIKAVILTPIRAVHDALSGKDGIWAKMHDAAEAAWDKIKTGAANFAGAIGNAVKSAFEGVVNKVIDFVNAIIGVINKIPGVPNIDKIGHIGDKAKGHGGPGGPNGTGQLAKGGAFARTGGMVTHPITLMGEEAPTHPEYVIPTNPAYRGRAKGLLAQAAGAIGYAEGGVLGGFRKAIKDIKPPAKANLALWEAGIVESGLRNLPYGDLDSRGALQIRDSTAKGMGLNNMSPYASAVAFLTQGFWGKGGADILAIQNPRQSAGWVAQNTQGSAYPARYDQVMSQALNYVKGYSGPVGGGPGLLGDVVNALNPMDFINKLPGVGGLPDWLKGTGKYVIGKVTDWIKDKVSGLVGGDDGGHATGSVAAAINLAQSLGFGYPSPGQLTGGDHVAGSLHYAGRAVDFGDAGHTKKQMDSLYYGLYAKFGKNLNELFYDREPWYIDNHAKHIGQFGGHDDHIHAAFAKGGMFGGLPFLGSYHSGGIAPREGIAHVQAGETMTPAGRGPLVHIEHAEFGSQIDVNSFAAKLGFKIATA